MSRRASDTSGPPRTFVLTYGALGYLCFLVSAVLLTWHLRPHATSTERADDSIAQAVLIDVALLVAFYVPHSVMARSAFKRAWTKYVPEIIERSTYVWVSSLLLIAIVWSWQPVPGNVWSADHPAALVGIYAGSIVAVALLIVSSRATREWDLFGVRRVWCHFRGREFQPPDEFVEHRLYRVVRHPMMVGIVILLWCTPTMTYDRFIFAVVSTVYIGVGTYYEERDLVAAYGEPYQQYRSSVPAFVPGSKSGRR